MIPARGEAPAFLIDSSIPESALKQIGIRHWVNLPITLAAPHHQFMDKIAALSEILQADPTNAFARYGLAMEHISAGNTDGALAEFTTLIQHSPDYVPAYQMSAQTLAKLGRTPDALDRLHTGIAAANRTGNQHALAEMEALRDDLNR
jgi:predicted Zn-dependent protease